MIGIVQDICTKIVPITKEHQKKSTAYLNEKMKNKTFSFYYSRKFADFAGLFMCFFCNNYVSGSVFTGYEKAYL